MTRFKNAKRQHDIISKKHKQAALRVTCSKLYDFSCLRRFQFSEIEYAKYPSPFIFFSEAPVFIGVSEGDGCYFTLQHPSSPFIKKRFEPQSKHYRRPERVIIEHNSKCIILLSCYISVIYFCTQSKK